MPGCQGRPNSPCPYLRKDDSVKFSQGDLFLCPDCLNFRFPLAPDNSSRVGKPNSPAISTEPVTQDNSRNACNKGRGGKEAASASNHNAKTGKTSIDTCREVQQWIQCDNCKDWIILENSGIAGDQSTASLSSIGFTCKMCQLRAQVNTLSAEVEKISKMLTNQSQLKEQISELSRENAALRTAMGKLNTQVDNRDTRIREEVVHDTANELYDQDRRKLNLVVFGLPESTDTDDKASFVDYANSYHILSSPLRQDDIVDTVRLGTRPAAGRPRALKLHFSSAAKRRMVLTMHLHRLPTERLPDSHRKLFIRPDLTRRQLESDKLLREELLRVGRDKYKISKGRIVSRTRDVTEGVGVTEAQQDMGITSTRTNTQIYVRRHSEVDTRMNASAIRSSVRAAPSTGERTIDIGETHTGIQEVSAASKSYPTADSNVPQFSIPSDPPRIYQSSPRNELVTSVSNTPNESVALIEVPCDNPDICLLSTPGTAGCAPGTSTCVTAATATLPALAVTTTPMQQQQHSTIANSQSGQTQTSVDRQSKTSTPGICQQKRNGSGATSSSSTSSLSTERKTASSKISQLAQRKSKSPVRKSTRIGASNKQTHL